MARRLFSFPNPVNEIAARTVAAGVVVMGVAFLVTQWQWLLFVLAYGFWARVLTGPKLSPLGRLATQVIVPRLPFPAKNVPGAPKRFAQGMGVAFSTGALVASLAGATPLALVLIGMLVVAASLEAFAGYCLGCKVFALLMRAHVIPATVCLECADISGRLNAAAARTN